MKLTSAKQLETTRKESCRRLERLLRRAIRTGQSMNQKVRDLTKRSLKRLINQLKEEIALYQIAQASASKGSA